MLFKKKYRTKHLLKLLCKKIHKQNNFILKLVILTLVFIVSNSNTYAYKKKLIQPNRKQLIINTSFILALSVIAVDVISILPKKISNWDKGDKSFNNWKNNVSQPPVWDKDGHITNYITHPYFGAIYYITARDSGYNEFSSFIYSTIISTFVWEYGFEALAERPSIQDLFSTPIGGWLMGEYLFIPIIMRIKENNGKLLGSTILGGTVNFILNPIINLSSLFGVKNKSYLSIKKNSLNFKQDFSQKTFRINNNHFRKNQNNKVWLLFNSEF